MTDRPTRAVAREITISAPVEAVWKALTDAEELTRWFPPRARVEPGEAGHLWREWQSGEEIEERILRWEPNVHLRTVGLVGAWKDIVTDYQLTTSGGQTVLRVVSSGFGLEADWDTLYEAFGSGWDFELHGLRHYLERHAGLPRLIVFARGSRALSASESWQRLMSPGGWLGPEGLTSSAEGSSYDVRLGDGRRLSGEVYLWQPPRQFAASVVELNNAYLRVDTRCLGETGTPLIWLSTYGVPAEAVREIERDWQASLDAALAVAESTTALSSLPPSSARA